MDSGYFLVVDGCNGTGKSTVCHLLAERLSANGHRGDVIVLRDPGSTEFAEIMRTLVKDPDVRMDKWSQFFLYCAARSDLARRVEGLLRSGTIVIMDRWWPSTEAYQRFVPKYLLDRILEASTFGNKYAPVGTPFTYAIIDCLPEIALERAGGTNKNAGPESGGDRFEAKGLKFAWSLRKTYLQIARRERFRIYGSSCMSAEEIAEALLKVVQVHVHE